MAVNKPVGDNARRGAVKRRSQMKTKLGGAMDEERSRLRRVHGGEKAGRKEGGGQKNSRASEPRKRPEAAREMPACRVTF